MRPLVGLAVTVGMILGTAILVVLLPNASNGDWPLFEGIPNDRIGATFRRADQAEAAISKNKAVDLALTGSSHSATEAVPKESRLLYLTEYTPCRTERLVWAVRFALPPLAPRPTTIMGPGPGVTGQWEYEIVVLDAMTGEVVMVMEQWRILGAPTPDPKATPIQHPEATTGLGPNTETCAPTPTS